jgi:hypothetical protein
MRYYCLNILKKLILEFSANLRETSTELLLLLGSSQCLLTDIIFLKVQQKVCSFYNLSSDVKFRICCNALLHKNSVWMSSKWPLKWPSVFQIYKYAAGKQLSGSLLLLHDKINKRLKFVSLYNCCIRCWIKIYIIRYLVIFFIKWTSSEIEQHAVF